MLIVTLICVLTSAKERGVEKKTMRELKKEEKGCWKRGGRIETRQTCA